MDILDLGQVSFNLVENTFATRQLQYRSNVSYHLSSRVLRDECRFSRDSSCFLRDDSCFSRYESRFSRESLRRSVWNILLVRSRFPCTVKGRYQSDETDRQDDKKDTERQLLASLKYLRYIASIYPVFIWHNWMIQTLK